MIFHIEKRFWSGYLPSDMTFSKGTVVFKLGVCIALMCAILAIHVYEHGVSNRRSERFRMPSPSRGNAVKSRRNYDIKSPKEKPTFNKTSTSSRRAQTRPSTYPLKTEVSRNTSPLGSYKTPGELMSVCRKQYLELPRKKMIDHTQDSDRVKEREMVYKRRNQRVREVCERYKDIRLDRYKPNEDKFFLFDIKNRLAWCRNPKVRDSACSTRCTFLH